MANRKAEEAAACLHFEQAVRRNLKELELCQFRALFPPRLDSHWRVQLTNSLGHCRQAACPYLDPEGAFQRPRGGHHREFALHDRQATAAGQPSHFMKSENRGSFFCFQKSILFWDFSGFVLGE